MIDAFVNIICLYEDKLILTFNYKDGTRTITLDDVKEATTKADAVRIWIALVRHIECL